LHRFKKNFRFILEGDRLDKIVQGDEIQRRGAQAQLLTLLGYDNGPLDEAEMLAVLDGFLGMLTTLEPDIDAALKGSPDKPFDQLGAVLTTVRTVLKDKNRVKKIFEGVEIHVAPNYKKLGKQILEEVRGDQSKILLFLREFNSAFLSLELAIIKDPRISSILLSDPSKKIEAKKAVANLFNLKPTERIYEHDVEPRIEALKVSLRSSRIMSDPIAATNYREFEAILNDVKKHLSEPVLTQIYT